MILMVHAVVNAIHVVDACIIREVRRRAVVILLMLLL